MFLAPAIDGGRDQPRAREADPRHAGRHADLVVRDRIGKLLSALTYVFILIVASIPLTAIVFVFGGVGPDEVLRGYVVLFVTAIGLGSLGLFISALMQRTQAATVVTFFGVLALTMGTLFVVLFWTTMAGISRTGRDRLRGLGPIKGRPPEALLWYNPFAAQYDVICGASDGYGGWCSRLADVTNGAISIGIGGGATGGVPVGTGVDTSGGHGGIVPGKGVAADVAPVQPFGIRRDTFWPRSVAAWLALSVVLVLASVQLVSPTRRWRLPFRRASPGARLMRFPRPSLPAALRRAGDRPVRDAVVAPPDPRSLGTPIDPLLESIRADLRPHLRRLWAPADRPPGVARRRRGARRRGRRCSRSGASCRSRSCPPSRSRSRSSASSSSSASRRRRGRGSARPRSRSTRRPISATGSRARSRSRRRFRTRGAARRRVADAERRRWRRRAARGRGVRPPPARRRGVVAPDRATQPVPAAPLAPARGGRARRVAPARAAGPAPEPAGRRDRPEPAHP